MQTKCFHLSLQHPVLSLQHHICICPYVIVLTVIYRKPQGAMKLMRLSTVWSRLAPNQTSPVHDRCQWSFLTHLPERVLINSLVFRGSDGAQSIHRVSTYLADLQELVC